MIAATIVVFDIRHEPWEGPSTKRQGYRLNEACGVFVAAGRMGNCTRSGYSIGSGAGTDVLSIRWNWSRSAWDSAGHPILSACCGKAGLTGMTLPALSETAVALCSLLILLVPLAVVGLALINTGLG